MANTRTTTPTKPLALAFGALGFMLAAFAAVNLFASFTPAADLDTSIETQLKAAADLPQAEELALLHGLKEKQEMALAARPSEPYGWAELSLLRSMTGDDRKEAFAALRTSDLVSPYEGHELPERALAWRGFRAIETPEQQDYQDTLWQKACTLDGPGTWDLARREKITGEVRDALMRKDPKLAGVWKSLMAEAGLRD